MAKRKAGAHRRKAARKTAKKAGRKAPKTARKSTSRPKARASRPPARREKVARARRTAPIRKAAPPRPAPKPKPAAKRLSIVRPKPAALSRERRQLKEEEKEEEMVPMPPSTLGYAPKASSAGSGHHLYDNKKREHTEGGTALTGGDLDSDWNDAYSSGEETPGGDMPTPDQDVVEEIGRALGVEYEDAEELKGADKIEDRDRHRWEYDPASAEDYRDRTRRGGDED